MAIYKPALLRSPEAHRILSRLEYQPSISLPQLAPAMRPDQPTKAEHHNRERTRRALGALIEYGYVDPLPPTDERTGDEIEAPRYALTDDGKILASRVTSARISHRAHIATSRKDQWIHHGARAFRRFGGTWFAAHALVGSLTPDGVNKSILGVTGGLFVVGSIPLAMETPNTMRRNADQDNAQEPRPNRVAQRDRAAVGKDQDGPDLRDLYPAAPTPLVLAAATKFRKQLLSQPIGDALRNPTMEWALRATRATSRTTADGVSPAIEIATQYFDDADEGRALGALAYLEQKGYLQEHVSASGLAYSVTEAGHELASGYWFGADALQAVITDTQAQMQLESAGLTSGLSDC